MTIHSRVLPPYLSLMPEVFVSYAHQDAARVQALVERLESTGCSVWWDRKITPGSHFEQAIEEALESAGCVLIALTRHAARSDWVRAEAAAAHHHNRVIPVLLDDVQIPLSLRALQVADLRLWPDAGHDEMDALLRAVTSGQTAMSSSDFVGRDDALRALQDAFANSLAGSGGLTVVTGEPGIGKTRCLEELARLVEDQGALVLWGRCFEQAGAPPFWPWVQILREYAESNSEDELRLLFGASLDAVGTLVPEIAARMDARLLDNATDRVDQRFHLFDALTRVFTRGAAMVPLVLMLDDLHWADESSLSLLEFLAHDAHRHRLLVVCAYRDVEVTRKSPLLGTLGELSRSGRVRRIRLGGLTVDETGELTRRTTGLRLNDSIVQAIYQQTDGNPLFVREVGKVLAEERASSSGDVIAVDVPDGVREAIGRRLNRLSDDCNGLLSIASVFGRDFRLPLVARVAAMPLDGCVAELETAVASGILQRRQDMAAEYRFTHALIRETVYEELPTGERLGRHRQIAGVLQEVYADDLDPVLSELVHHASESSVLGDHQEAVDLALMAAARDERVHALEEACRHYEVALGILRANGEGQSVKGAKASFAIGRLSDMLGRVDQSVEHLRQGVDLSRRIGDGRLFVQAAIELVRMTSYLTSFDAVALMDEALERVPAENLRDRALILGHRVLALRRSGEASLVTQAAVQAIAFAREIGDRSALVKALRLSVMGLRGFHDTLRQRIEYCDQAIELSDGSEDRHEFVENYYWQALNMLEAGDIDRFEYMLDRHTRTSEEFSLARQQLQGQLLHGTLHLLRGSWEEAERCAVQALDLGRRLADGTQDAEGVDAEGVYGTQMFVLNRDLGRLQAMAPLIRRMIEESGPKLWAPGLMLICCEVGLLDEARRKLGELSRDGFARIVHDDMWLTCMVFCAETSARLGEAECAATLYDLLLPYAEQTAVQPTAACFGAVERYLGLLAGVLGRDDAARGHLERAVDRNRAMGAWPMLARTQLDLARLLITSQRAEDQAPGRRLLAEAEQLATRFRMAALQREIGSFEHAGEPSWPDDLTAREVDVIRLLAIGRSNKDISTVLGISLSTVATHVRSILTKTGCANRTEAAAYAIRNGLN